MSTQGKPGECAWGAPTMPLVDNELDGTLLANDLVIAWLLAVLLLSMEKTSMPLRAIRRLSGCR